MKGTNRPKWSARKALVYVWVFTVGYAAVLSIIDLLTVGKIGVNTFLWPYVWGQLWAAGAMWQVSFLLAIWVTVRVVSGRWDAKR